MKLLKTILAWGFLIGDIVLVMFLISLVGFREFGIFTLYYFLGMILSTIGYGLLGGIKPDEWEKEFKKNKMKIKYKMVLGVGAILIVGILSILVVIPPTAGFLTGYLVVTYMIFLCKDILFMLSEFRNNLESMIESKYPKYFKGDKK